MSTPRKIDPCDRDGVNNDVIYATARLRLTFARDREINVGAAELAAELNRNIYLFDRLDRCSLYLIINGLAAFAERRAQIRAARRTAARDGESTGGRSRSSS